MKAPIETDPFLVVMSVVCRINKETPGVGPAFRIRGALEAGCALGLFHHGLGVDGVLDALHEVLERLGPTNTVGEFVEAARQEIGR